MNELDAGHDRATPASVGHDADEPLTPISPYCRLHVCRVVRIQPPIVDSRAFLFLLRNPITTENFHFFLNVRSRPLS
jgi:hypothetical protein